jgi:hypothetical protein
VLEKKVWTKPVLTKLGNLGDVSAEFDPEGSLTYEQWNACCRLRSELQSHDRLKSRA